jgi:hypothetical protein
LKEFCKIFESVEFGQILVIKDTREDDGVPSVFIKFEPEGMGICGPTYSFTDEDEDEAWVKADKMFDGLNLDEVESVAREVSSMCKGMVTD